MGKMTFRDWEWPENPEIFLIRAETAPEYGVDTDGNTVFCGMSPVCRVITGKGIFLGAEAHTWFWQLMIMIREKKVGKLVHPLWGSFSVYLTELVMEEECSEDCVVYSFTFKEADEAGIVPLLPRYPSMVQNVMTTEESAE